MQAIDFKPNKVWVDEVMAFCNSHPKINNNNNTAAETTTPSPIPKNKSDHSPTPQQPLKITPRELSALKEYTPYLSSSKRVPQPVDVLQYDQ